MAIATAYKLGSKADKPQTVAPAETAEPAGQNDSLDELKVSGSYFLHNFYLLKSPKGMKIAVSNLNSRNYK